MKKRKTEMLHNVKVINRESRACALMRCIRWFKGMEIGRGVTFKPRRWRYFKDILMF